MVKRLLFLILLLPLSIFAGEFTATVSKNQITLGEHFTLSLTLKDATATDSPFIAPLKQSFFIASQQHSTQTVSINGQRSTYTTWRYTLIPQTDGETVIPAITIDTTQGVLSSDPFTVRVVKADAADGANASSVDGVKLTTIVSNQKPYKNEPIHYTARLSASREMANIMIQKVEVQDAIVEADGEPKVSERIVGGVREDVVDFSYIITPLKAGPLKIPSQLVKGMIPAGRKDRSRSFFDDDFDPFIMMHGLERMKPFVLSTDEVLVDVQPAVADVTPWLPARSLKVEEIWNSSQKIQVGEPFTRSFKITADGLKASQLPSLNDMQVSDAHFKIYADKPDTKDDVQHEAIKSTREEKYTLIPQQPGTLTLPEITVVWWNVKTNAREVVRVPARTLEVLPALVSSRHQEAAPVAETAAADAGQAGEVTRRDPLLYVIIAGLSALLMLAFVWGIFLQKKIARLTQKTTESKPAAKQEGDLQYAKPKVAKDKNEKLPDLNPT